MTLTAGRSFGSGPTGGREYPPRDLGVDALMDGPVTDPEALWLLRKAKHAASPEEAAMLKRIAVIYDQRGKALYG